MVVNLRIHSESNNSNKLTQMKTLITNSYKLFRALHPSQYLLSSTNYLPLSNNFATTKPSQKSPTTNPKKSSSKLQPEKSIEPLSVQQRELKVMSASRQQLQHDALEIIKSYITIDQIKCHPGAIRLLLLTFTRTLEYDPTNRGRIFYLTHKQAIEKIFYDLRSYNAQSQMCSQDILLTYYFYKLLKDYGYSFPPTGFELRSGIKLAQHVPMKQKKAQGVDTLSLDQVIHARWLMAVTGNSNHEFKWNSHVMLVEALSQWKKANPYDHTTSTQTTFSQLPIKLHHICTVLNSFYYQNIHLVSDFKSVQFMTKILFVNAQNYISYDKLMANENIFLEAFACLIGLELHFFSGNNFHEMRIVVGQIAAVIERRLMGWVVKDEDVKGAFVKSSSLEIFLASDSYGKYQNIINSKDQANQLMQNFTDQDLYRYFVLLNEIHQNQSFFHRVAPENYEKLMFILKQIFEQYFTSRINNKENAMNGQILSIYTRFKLIMLEKQLHRLQKQKSGQKVGGHEKMEQQVNEIVKDFMQLIQTLKEKSKLLNLTVQQSRKPYLTVQQKEVVKQKQLQLIKIQRNIISPLIDFLYSLRKYTSATQQKLLQPSVVTSMITQLQPLLAQLFNSPQHPSIQNRYFWLLKFLHLSFKTTTDNKFYLKQFQSFLLQHVVKNNQKPQPNNFYTVSVYNLYAYMCQLQEKIMENESMGEGLKGQEGQETNGFYGKKQYKYFLAYKQYLAKLIFDQNFDYAQIQSHQQNDLKIPTKLRIDTLFTRSHPHQEPHPHPKLSISDFFHTIFRSNRFSNHKLLSEQFLAQLFGNDQLFNQNFSQFIQNKNQRSGQNFHEIIYMILLAGDRTIGHGKSVWDLPTIKRKLFQALTQKSVGSLVINIIREIAAPRKTSFFKRNPLKYRLNSYSLFQTVQYDSLKRKKQVLTGLLQLYSPAKSINFGFLEILLHNLDLWNPQEKSQIVWAVIMSWAIHRIQQGQTPETAHDVYFNLTIRLPRRCQVGINPEHQHVFLQVISTHLPKIFQKISKTTKQKRKFTDANGYLLDLEAIYNQNSLDFKNLTPILEKCREILLKNDSDSKDTPNYGDKRSYSMVFSALQRLLSVCRSSKKAFGSSGQKAHSKQSQKITATGKLFNASNQKTTNISSQNKQSEEKVAKSQEKPHYSQTSQSKLFKASSKRQKRPEVQKNQTVKKGMFSKKE